MTTPPVYALPQQQVVIVKGEEGARAYQMGANSSAILLDESGLIAWLVTTDGAGYKSVYAYDITPHQTAPAPDYSMMNERITKLETELEAIINELTANTATTAKPYNNNTNTNSSNNSNSNGNSNAKSNGSNAK